MQNGFNYRAPTKPTPDAINLPLTGNGNTYLHELCVGGAPKELIREAVLSLGADMHTLNRQNLPPLGLAIVQGNLEVILCMIDLGAELYFPVSEGKYFNAASLAVFLGDPLVLALILKNGGGLHVNQTGSYPPEREELPCLAVAINERRHMMIEMLANAGAFLDQESGREKLSPLQRAAATPSGDTIGTLVRMGASVDQVNSASGMTALHYAVAGGQPNAVDDLLKMGADANGKNTAESGETPLHNAASKGQMHMVQSLLEGGADPLLTDKFNRTASCCARNSGYQHVAQKLEEEEVKTEQAFFEKARNDLRRRPNAP